MRFMLYFFAIQTVALNNGTMSSTRSNLCPPPLQPLLYRNHWLPISCCLLLLSFCHLRPRIVNSLFFDVCCLASPKQANQPWRHDIQPLAPSLAWCVISVYPFLLHHFCPCLFCNGAHHVDWLNHGPLPILRGDTALFFSLRKAEEIVDIRANDCLLTQSNFF